MTVEVAPVPGEGTRDNNRVRYQVAFTKGQFAVSSSQSAAPDCLRTSPPTAISFSGARRPHNGCRNRRAGGRWGGGRWRCCWFSSCSSSCDGCEERRPPCWGPAGSATWSRMPRTSRSPSWSSRAGRVDLRAGAGSARERRGADRPRHQPHGGDPVRRLQRDERSAVELDGAARRARAPASCCPRSCIATRPGCT